jgi:hypothetical protein
MRNEMKCSPDAIRRSRWAGGTISKQRGMQSRHRPDRGGVRFDEVEKQAGQNGRNSKR